MTLRARPFTKEAFAPYGDVISAGVTAGSSANMGTATRFDWCTALINARPNAKANIAVFRSLAKSLPFPVELLERHPFSTQAFVPMVCTRFLVCVAPDAPDGGPDVSRLEAFLCTPGQGLNYRQGVWHHPLIAIDGPADLVMVAFEDGTVGDCEVRKLPAPVLVST